MSRIPSYKWNVQNNDQKRQVQGDFWDEIRVKNATRITEEFLKAFAENVLNGIYENNNSDFQMWKVNDYK